MARKGVRKPIYKQPSLFPEFDAPLPINHSMMINDLHLNGRVYLNDNGVYKEQINRNFYEVTNQLIIDELEKLWKDQNGLNNSLPLEKVL